MISRRSGSVAAIRLESPRQDDVARIGQAGTFDSAIMTIVRRPRKRFVRAIGRFVAWPLPGPISALNVYASMRGRFP